LIDGMWLKGKPAVSYRLVSLELYRVLTKN